MSPGFRKAYSQKEYAQKKIHQIGRSVHRRKGRDLCALLLFMLLLPYAVSLLFGQREENFVREVWAAGAQNGTEPLLKDQAFMVDLEEETGSRQVDLSEYLTGSLAASMPADCHPEALKAQAVILRTLSLQALKESGTLTARQIGQAYKSRAELAKLWGEEAPARYQKLREAVEATDGMVLAYDGSLAKPAYFWLSNGQSRDSAQVDGMEALPYLQSVDCSWDVKAEEYETQVQLSYPDFLASLRQLAGLADDAQAGELKLYKDDAGYVSQVQYGGRKVPGEVFRDFFDLPSACFSLSVSDGQVFICVRGKGHGLGFSQYSANEQAMQGADFITLLKYFFPGIQIEKIE